jgi:hypothetical protein
MCFVNEREIYDTDSCMLSVDSALKSAEKWEPARSKNHDEEIFAANVLIQVNSFHWIMMMIQMSVPAIFI